MPISLLECNMNLNGTYILRAYGLFLIDLIDVQ